MKISKQISIIIFSFLIAHVYSFVHWHAHEDENQIEIHLSVHPPDLPIHEHHHDNHQCHTQHTGESNVLGEWNFTIQKTNPKVYTPDCLFVYYTLPDEKLKVFAVNFPEFDLKLPQNDLIKILPQRAPPITS